MKIEIKEWPESQEVMENPEWFFISNPDGRLSDCCYGKFIKEEE